MEQNTTNIVVNATEDFLRDSLAKATLRIAELEEHIQKVTQRSYADSADKNRLVEQMQEWTLSALEAGSINETEAEEIAEIVGFELTKEFEVEVTVMYSITVNARDEESAQNAIHDIDFDTVQYSDENISWLSSSIDRVEIQQGATKHGPEHVFKLLLKFPQKNADPQNFNLSSYEPVIKITQKMSDLYHV